jgi:hypothetical protein
VAIVRGALASDNAEGFKQGAKFGEAALSRQAEGALLKILLC